MSCVRCVVFLVLLAMAALALVAAIPRPGAPRHVLHGTVIRADLGPGGKGARTLLWVRLDDGSKVSCTGGAGILPAVSSRIDVVESRALFGLRQIDCLR